MRHGTSRPNILLIMTDQQRFDSLSCYGCGAIKTPNLDHLAAGGVRFDNCYVNATICTPSRASIMTGKPVSGHGVYKLHDNLPEDEVLISERLRRKGYQTALIGKLHVSGRVTEARERHPNDGFDVYDWCLDPGGLHFDSQFNAYARWLESNHPAFFERLQKEGRKTRNFPAETHFSTWAAERTIELLQKRDRSKPFFYKMSLFDPHDPYFDYPPEAAALVDISRLPDIVTDDEAGNPIPADLIREQKRTFYRGGKRPTPDEIEQIRLGYYASIAFFDVQIGRVLDTLDKEGLAGNTMVIFVSDHGDMMGDHELLMKGPHFYDPCAKVPFIIRYPAEIPSETGDLESGLAIEELVQPHDIAATVLSAAGFSAEELHSIMPHSMDLLPLVGAAAGEAASHGRGYAVSEYRNAGYGTGGRYFDPPVHCTMFRDKRYKLTVYHRMDMPACEPEGQLFDMEADPLELNNLWNNADYAAIKSVMTGRLMDWMVETSCTYAGTRGGEAVTWEA